MYTWVAWYKHLCTVPPLLQLADCCLLFVLQWSIVLLCLPIVLCALCPTQVEVKIELARGLLEASDQYLLEGLKRLCEMAIAQALSVDNLTDVFALSEAYSAPQLGKQCVLFALEHYDDIIKGSINARSYVLLMQKMVPLLKASLLEDLSKELVDEPAVAEPAAAAVAAPAAGGGAVVVVD